MKVFMVLLFLSLNAYPMKPIYSTDRLEAMFQNPKEDLAAAEYLLSHTKHHHPFNLVLAAQALFNHGRREQGAFVFYLFQLRINPWVTAGKDSGMSSLVGALKQSVGSQVHSWIGSDPEAWQELALKAQAAEKKLPLAEQLPPGMTKEKWLALNEELRSKSSKELAETFRSLLKEGKDAFLKQRRANKLHVGPWIDPGPPIPIGWL